MPPNAKDRARDSDPDDAGDPEGAPAADEGEAESIEQAHARERAMRPSRGLRFVFYGLWLFAAGALAWGAVQLLKPPPFAADVGVIRQFVAEQQVPATILFFTLFAMILWRFRFVLPLAGAAGLLGRRDLPRHLRARFDGAAQLCEEARRIMRLRKRDVQRALSQKERDEITRALDRLEEQMLATPLREDRFQSALAKAEQLVSDRLARWRKGEVREYGESIAVAVAVALLLRVFVIEAFKIPSGSMIPTLMIGDHIFVAKYAYGPLMPRSDTRLFERLPPTRGDVMVFKFPENEEQDFIKRTIALPGDTLEVLNGRPILNGFLVPNCYVGRVDMPYGAKGYLYLEHLGDKSYLTMFDEKPSGGLKCERDRDCGGARACRAGSCGLLQGPYQVKPGEVWVLGDNRNNSHDSRSWRGGLGAGVPFKNIKGRATFVWISWHPNGGIAWERLLVDVMGPPKLPTGVPAELLMGLQRCTRERPPLAETTPPAGK